MEWEEPHQLVVSQKEDGLHRRQRGGKGRRREEERAEEDGRQAVVWVFKYTNNPGSVVCVLLFNSGWLRLNPCHTLGHQIRVSSFHRWRDLEVTWFDGVGDCTEGVGLGLGTMQSLPKFIELDRNRPDLFSDFPSPGSYLLLFLHLSRVHTCSRKVPPPRAVLLEFFKNMQIWTISWEHLQ